MVKQKKVTYVVGVTPGARPITVTHVVSKEESPEAKVNDPASCCLPESKATSLPQRKTCSHSQNDARVRYKAQKSKKKK